MIFDEFIAKWTGQTVDFDKIYPNQCMDLMHQYVYDVLGLTDKSILAAPAAYQVYINFSSTWAQYFDKIDNDPSNATQVPQKGDILFFGTAIGAFGHVCIVIDAPQGVNDFKSFDANWPTGSLPHIQDHNYNGVLGWLRPKNTNPTQVSVDTNVFNNLVHNSTVTDAINDYFGLPHNSDWETIKARIENLKDQIASLNSQINNIHAANTQQASMIADLNTNVAQLQSQNTTLTQELTDVRGSKALPPQSEVTPLQTALPTIIATNPGMVATSATVIPTKLTLWSIIIAIVTGKR